MTAMSIKSGMRQLSRGRLLGGGRRGGIPALVILAAAATALAIAGPAAAAKSSNSAASASAAPAIVAEAAVKSVAIYRSPTAKSPFMRLSNPNADGGQLVFLVKHRVAGWEQVLLAKRPNGTTGWLKDSSVQLVLDPYSVSVSLSAHRITARKDGRVILSAPAGVGRSVLPTPTGTYYIVELLKQSNPSGPYGPYAFGLSAFSNVLYSFGGGPGEIGLHGTDEPAALGTSVSHGCIRVSNSIIARLAGILPLGTPVRIVG
jgi:lipoprotein-anchoring transpeptidase ErfK/SrfK